MVTTLGEPKPQFDIKVINCKDFNASSSTVTLREDKKLNLLTL